MTGAIRRLDGSTLSPAEVTRTVERLMAVGRVPGLALAILNQGEIVYQRAFGYRDVERQLPLTDTTIMYVASFTKAMAAYLTMQIVDERKIDLDWPVQSYLSKPLPEYEDWAELAADERYTRITPRMLLSHTAGFPNWRFISPTGEYEPHRKLVIHFEPGTRYSYSGEGIQLLQLLIEEVTRQSIGDLMREKVFVPLGMTRTSMVWEPYFAADMANGYDEAGKSLGHNARRRPRAAGSVDSNLRDVDLFARAVLRGDGLSAAARWEMCSFTWRLYP
jgi:CubicO group peptidase (beta-lactamase class C family)